MTAKYQQIADELRSKILTREYKAGTVIPPELRLQEQYHVSRHTIRQAIAVLVNEGLLRKEKGSGTYVLELSDSSSTQKKRYKTIGVITTYLSDYIFPSIIRGIEETLRNNGYSLLLASTNNDPNQERTCLENMLAQEVDGLIVEPTKSNQYNPNIAYYLTLKEAGIPVVMINAYYETIELPSICLDDVQAGYLATTYLLEQGHRNLALISKLDDLQGKFRMKGFIEAHEKQGLSFEASSIYTYTTETRGDVLAQAAAALSSPNNQVSGIVCYNDEVANQLIQQLSSQGIRIPEDLSVIGQDDSYLSTAGEVPLTTISHPKEALGQQAAQWMLAAVEKGQRGDSLRFTPEVIQRKSVKKYVQN